MKYIVVDCCLGCQYITVTETLDMFYCCKLEKILDDDTGKTIPDWCELPDLESKEVK